MQFSVSGTTGFIGSALIQKIVSNNLNATMINRQSFEMSDQEFLEKKIEGADVVINLAGTPVIRKWTDINKKEIYDSRILTTRKIANAIRNASKKPKVFILNAAMGIYDSSHEHTEASTNFDKGFLADLCRDWEAEAMAVKDVTRVVIFRTGIVIGKNGGALEKMQALFNVGLGAIIGSGRQTMSWIHLDDLLDAFLFVVEHEEIQGVVNAVAPYVTTNAHFSETFGKVLTQPVFLHVPVFALKMIYGEGTQALIAGQKVRPEKLLKAGFDFKFLTIEKALMNIYK